MKHLKTYNESLRDEMKPKSDEEIKDAYDNTIAPYNNPCSGFIEEYTEEYTKVANVLKSNLNDLHLITESEDEYPTFRRLFFELTPDWEKDFVLVEVISEHGDAYSGKWKCFPKQKLAFFTHKVIIDGKEIDDYSDNWIFDKPYLKELITKQYDN